MLIQRPEIQIFDYILQIENRVESLIAQAQEKIQSRRHKKEEELEKTYEERVQSLSSRLGG